MQFPTGFIQHSGGAQAIPAVAHYDRLTWRELARISTAPDGSLTQSYTFGPIDALLKQPLPLGIRVRGMKAGENTEGTRPSKRIKNVPDGIPGAFYPHRGDELFVPEWNNPRVIRLMCELIAAIGKAYDGRLLWIDANVDGVWGEGHNYQLPKEAPLANEATLRTFIDAFAAAFQKTQLIALAGQKEVLPHIVARYPGRFGLRLDSWGDAKGIDRVLLDRHSAAMQEEIKWWQERHGPLIFEPNNPFDIMAPQSLAQLEKWRPTLISYQNMKPLSKQTAAEKERLNAFHALLRRPTTPAPSPDYPARIARLETALASAQAEIVAYKARAEQAEQRATQAEASAQKRHDEAVALRAALDVVRQAVEGV